MRTLLTLGSLLLFFRPAAPQVWYDPEEDYQTPPPAAAEHFERLGQSDLLAAQKLTMEITAGRISEAHFVDGEDPYCEIEAYSENAHFRVRTDPLGTTVRSQEEIPRFPGWPMEGDWVELPSGVKYYDVKVGAGEEPKNSTWYAVAHWDGYLNNGRLFDSTQFRAGEPQKFPLRGVIKGWQEALLSMKEGGKRKILVPPDLGYGEKGNAPSVPPNATLLFDTTLRRVSRR